MTTFDFTGKRVLVTQSTSFMGPSLCQLFTEFGANVIADDRALLDPGLPDSILQNAGHVDILIANLALPAPSTPAVDVGDDEWRSAFAQLVDPLPRLIRAILPQMIARKSGKILLIGSSSALRGMKRTSTYSAARGAQLAYVQSVGVEVASHGRRVEGRNLIDGDPEVVIGRQHREAQEHQRTTSDQDRANAGFVNCPEERQFIEIRTAHGFRIIEGFFRRGLTG